MYDISHRKKNNKNNVHLQAKKEMHYHCKDKLSLIHFLTLELKANISSMLAVADILPNTDWVRSSLIITYSLHVGICIRLYETYVLSTTSECWEGLSVGPSFVVSE